MNPPLPDRVAAWVRWHLRVLIDRPDDAGRADLLAEAALEWSRMETWERDLASWARVELLGRWSEVVGCSVP